MKEKKYLIFSTVILIALLVFGVSYSFYKARIEGNTKSISLKTKGIYLLYKGDLNLVSENDDEDKEDEESDVFDDLKLPDNFFKEGKKRKREEENEENGFIEEKENNNDDNKGNKKRKIENNVVINAESKVLDENSDEYWLELRRKIGLK